MILQDETSTRLRDFLQARERRRRRTLVLVGVVALALVVVLGVVIRRTARHIAAASRLEALGFHVDWYYGDTPIWEGGETTLAFRRPLYMPMQTSRPTPQDWALLAQLRNLRSIELSGYPYIDDAMIRALGPQPELTTLRLSSEPDGYEAKSPTGRLTDASLVAIGKMSRLVTLHLSGQPITDQGIASLMGLADLVEIDLDGTSITDAGLAQLANLPSLHSIRVSGSKITSEGVAAIGHRPDLTVLRVDEP
ncbi:MAG: hypothetical protein SFX72_03805 [Isosphaeraceae bacterium]|nr:hypothetical protein [Isosphaeraceae bacterium]